MNSKLVFSPRIYGNHHPMMPPLGISLITNHLRTNGFRVEQDDLDIKLHKKPEINLDIFENKERINDHILNGKDDEKIEKIGEQMMKLISPERNDLIGFSIVDPIGYCPSSSTLLMSKMIKERFDIPVVVGGLFNQENADYFLRTGFVDYSIIGYGEEGFRGIVEHIENPKDLKKIPGISFLDSGKTFHNPVQQNSCKFPDFDGLPLDLYKFSLSDYSNGFLKTEKDMLVLPYYFMNGCPNNCAFCGQSIAGLPFESKEPKKISEELDILSEKYRTNYFCFLNTTMNFSRKFTESLCNEMEERNLDITWTDSANFGELDENLIKRLRKNGLVRVLFGLESASQKVLDYINKRIDLKTLQGLLNASHENNIWNEIYLIAGLPYEKKEDISNTVSFLGKNSNNINFIHLNRFRLIESSFMENPEKYGLSNISPIADEETNYSEYYTNRFDEKEGLEWDKKVEQIENSFNDIKDTILRTGITSSKQFSSSHLQSIFSLFTLFDSINDVEENYVEVQKKAMEI